MGSNRIVLHGLRRWVHRGAAGGRPRPWVRCGHPPTWRASAQDVASKGIRWSISVAHVAGFGAGCTELPLVCAHERDFREESRPKCAELPHVRGFSRATCRRARTRAGLPCSVRRTWVGACSRSAVQCAACIERARAVAHVAGFGARFIEGRWVVDHVHGFDANIRPRNGLRRAICTEGSLVVDFGRSRPRVRCAIYRAVPIRHREITCGFSSYSDGNDSIFIAWQLS